MITIKFKKTHPDAILPKKNNPNPLTGDSGYDIFSIEDTLIPARGSAIVPVGFEVADMTPGYWFRIEARSGLGFKHGLQPHFGVIDNGYRGNLGVKITNLSDKDHMIEKGKACAQFIVYRILKTQVEWSETKTDSDRGDKGFGSSDSSKP